MLLLSLGIAGSMRLHAGLHLDGDIAAQRSAAVRLAQLDLEGQRAFTVVAPAPGRASYMHLETGGSALVESDNTVYTVQRQIVDGDTASLKFSTVEVGWPDRSGSRQKVRLFSGISASLPATTGALAVAPGISALSHPLGRHPGIPRTAHQLGDGRSLWQMGGNRPVAYVFDNLSGDIRSRCTGRFSPPSASAPSTDPDSCEDFRGTLLQGHVRFDLGTAPDGAQADDAPLPFDVSLQLDPPPETDPQCELQPPSSRRQSAPRAVPPATPGGTVPGARTGPATSTPQAPRPNESGEPGWAYTCVVPSPPSGGWSGRFSLLPSGWAVGTQPSQHRVCRYSADLDHSGSIDRNDEHPGRYSAVASHLAGQDYLVIRGELSCPRSPASPHNEVFADTVQHQP